MRFNHVLFIYPTYHGGFYEEPSPSPQVGLGYIVEHLQANGVKCSVIDMTFGGSTQDVCSFIKANHVDLVGITMMSFRSRDSYKLVADIRSGTENVPVIVGGAHASAVRETVLRDCPEIDFAVVGEGEITMLELCSGKEMGEIKGLIHRENLGIVFNGPREFMADLDSLAFPQYKPFNPERYKIISISTSRGCPFNCIYCQSRMLNGTRWRARSAENVAAEIKYWYEQGRRRLTICDECVSINRERMKKICEKLVEMNLSGLTMSVGGLRADTIDRDMLELMKAAGVTGIGIGVEGGNDKMLSILNKGETMEKINTAIANACELGFNVKLYFIIGSPNETWEDFMDSVKLAEKYPVNQVNFYSMMPIPKTALYDWVEKNGRFLYSPNHYMNEMTPWARVPFYDGPGMTIEEKAKAIRVGVKTTRKIAARRLFSASFGQLGEKVSDFLHDCPASYSVIYKSRKLKNIIKKMVR